MRDEVFAATGKFYRGNLHTHSNRSDGLLDPAVVCQRYRDEGYDFIALTDHFVGAFDYPITDTTSFRTNKFTTILGAELHSGAMENGELWHVLAVGLPQDFAPSNSPSFVPVENQESGAQIAKRARDAGAYVAVAHPQWSGMTAVDAMSIDAAHAVEIYNHGCAVDCDRADGFHMLDLMLTRGRILTCCATDDAHFHTPDYFGGWVMVKSEANEPDALLAALKAGHYYSSQGPQIEDIVWEKDRVTVTSSAVKTVIVQAQGSATAVVHGEAMNEAVVHLGRCGSSPWLRVTLIDAQGKRAWSNPHFRPKE